MPLLGGGPETSPCAGTEPQLLRRQSQLSQMAKSAILSSASSSPSSDDRASFDDHNSFYEASAPMAPPRTVPSRSNINQLHKDNKPSTSQHLLNSTNAVGHALNDTPVSTAPTSPQM